MSRTLEETSPPPPILEGVLGFQVLVFYLGRAFILTGPLVDQVRAAVKQEVQRREPEAFTKADTEFEIWAA